MIISTYRTVVRNDSTQAKSPGDCFLCHRCEREGNSAELWAWLKGKELTFTEHLPRVKDCIVELGQATVKNWSQCVPWPKQNSSTSITHLTGKVDVPSGLLAVFHMAMLRPRFLLSHGSVPLLIACIQLTERICVASVLSPLWRTTHQATSGSK